MAIAIASGVPPQMGLYTAIVGGFIISALGGSRFQIGGPAGAFIVLVAATVAEHGIEGMVLATMLAGVMTGALGLLRLGGYIRYIPYPVTVGFTAGIGVIIFASQIKDLFGLTLGVPEPGPILDKLEKTKASIRAKVEHPFRVIKRQFGYVKVKYRGLAKNTANLMTLFALSNIWMVRKRLLNIWAQG
jgi:MFS superfamily sulfate permease-like transporter